MTIEQVKGEHPSERILQRILAGSVAQDDDKTWLESSDVLQVGALADAQREHFLGKDVWLFEGPLPGAFQKSMVIYRPAEKMTGLQYMHALGVLRLSTPAEVRIGVDVEILGFELSQVSLMFGVSVMVNVLPNVKKTNGHLSIVPTHGPSRAEEVFELVRRAGRAPVWMSGHDAPAIALA